MTGEPDCLLFCRSFFFKDEATPETKESIDRSMNIDIVDWICYE